MAQAHPHQQYSSQSFSPPVSSPSPGAGSPANVGAYPPPPKRQRLSPLPQSQSPYASPNFSTMQISQGQSPVMNGATANGAASTPGSAPGTVAGTTGPAPPGSMGPPSRPFEKLADASELTDVLASSGIDVKEEEAYLTGSFAPLGSQTQPQQRPPLPTLNTSFTSQASTSGTASAGGSFEMPSQRLPSTQETSFVGQPPGPAPAPAPFQDPNLPTREDTQAARRSQYHLQDPFLLTRVLEQKLQKRGRDLGVHIPTEGVWHPVAAPGMQQPIEVTGPDGSSTVRKGHSIINQEGAPLVDILTLLSLSCQDRLRTVLEYAATLSKSRRLHSQGVVPPEWQDVAAQNGSATDSLKRSHSSTETSMIYDKAAKYRLLSSKDHSAEEARIAKRTKRNAAALINDSDAQAGSGASTPTGPGLVAPKGMTKKEAKRQMDARASEAQQHQQSIETARMATNNIISSQRFGKKQYNWLNRSTPVSSFSTPRTQSPAAAGGGDRPGKPQATTPKRRMGDWREDRSSGIQVRDLLFMLELDGRGARHLQKAYSKDFKEDRMEL